MSQDHDKEFFNTFAIVIGILVLIAIVILWLSNVIARQNVADAKRNAYAQELVVERIKPAGEVAVDSAATGDGGADAGSAVAASGGSSTGKSTYDSACFACHGTGAAGAPRVGDSADWNARLKQGREVLIDHAINGYQGAKGFMPPKGGQMQLSDEAVIAALDYMLDQSE